METIIVHEEKEIMITHTEVVTKCAFDHRGNTLELEVLSASNNKKAKVIEVSVVKTLKDSEGEIIMSSRHDYSITNPAEYSLFYNMPTVEGQGLGFTEYMHALNGAIARCPELGGSSQGSGIRPFNANGAIKPEYLPS